MDIVRYAIETLYDDICNVIENQEITDPITKRTGFHEVSVITNQPCKLSFGSFPSTTDGGTAEMAQRVKLFISPDINIKPGSKIVVTRKGHEPVEYSNSGVPAIFTNHQEIELKLFERWV